ncbi:hypothetical protein VPH35_038907 [Triticum aestivum]
MKDKQRAIPAVGEEPKTDVRIVAEVLKGVSKHSTFLASMGESSTSRQKLTSHERIRELEERLVTHEVAARSAFDRYQEELNARMVTQEQEIEEMKAKQLDEIAPLKKAHEEKTPSMELKQSQLEGTLGFLLRMQDGSDKSMSQPILGGFDCWKYALEAIIKWLLLYFLIHDKGLLFMLELY